MQRELFFSILSFCFALWFVGDYWKGIVRWQIIPHPFTFFLWVVVLGITARELIRADELIGSASVLLFIVSNFGCLIVWLYNYKKIQINWMDWFFLCAWIFLVIFWRFEPTYAYVLLVMIAIDATAYASSFKKTWMQPFTEKSLPYFISVGSNLTTILAISVWNFENLGMWIWTSSINLIFACFILARQYSMKK